MYDEDRKPLKLICTLIALIFIWAAMAIMYFLFFKNSNTPTEIIKYILIILACCTVCVLIKIISIAFLVNHNKLSTIFGFIGIIAFDLTCFLGDEYTQAYFTTEIISAAPQWALTACMVTTLFVYGLILSLILDQASGIFSAISSLFFVIISVIAGAAMYFILPLCSLSTEQLTNIYLYLPMHSITVCGALFIVFAIATISYYKIK